MTVKVSTTKAADPSNGMTVQELEDAMLGIPSFARISASVTWKGRLKEIAFTFDPDDMPTGATVSWRAPETETGWVGPSE